jgi:hypothetical protein
MPMDDYDDLHKTNYDHVINVYRYDVISDIITSLNNDPNDPNDVHFNNELTKTITRLRYALEVLDSRHITNIGARILKCNISKIDPIAEQAGYDHYLIQVWRGSRHSEWPI